LGHDSDLYQLQYHLNGN